MHAVRSAEQETLPPEEQAEWLRIIDDLGAKRQLLVVSKSVEENLEKPGVLEFLSWLWQEEEGERRRREKWLIPGAVTLFLLLVLLILALGIWTLIAMLR
ncbi:MAG: hypothetical protein H8F28_05420, partial [Fibrella sp.]|nr:hypothetical protein [Armatimonadota bacterium]